MTTENEPYPPQVVVEELTAATEIADNGEASEVVKRLRHQILCSEFVDCLSPDAEQFFLLAMGSLEQAQRFFELARMQHARVLASRQGIR